MKVVLQNKPKARVETRMVREIIDDFGMTNADLAEELGTGTWTVDKWYRGETRPQLQHRKRLHAFHELVRFLLDRKVKFVDVALAHLSVRQVYLDKRAEQQQQGAA